MVHVKDPCVCKGQRSYGEASNFSVKINIQQCFISEHVVPLTSEHHPFESLKRRRLRLHIIFCLTHSLLWTRAVWLSNSCSLQSIGEKTVSILPFLQPCEIWFILSIPLCRHDYGESIRAVRIIWRKCLSSGVCVCFIIEHIHAPRTALWECV